MEQSLIRHLFPGSNTFAGFMGFFEDLRSRARRTVILKGGPGVGKSTLMKAAGTHFEERGKAVIYYHCSGDPDSLDAVFNPESGFLVLDGTAPHIVDPRYPGAADSILNLGVCLDEAQLEGEMNALLPLYESISAAYQRAYRYLAAAHSLRADAAAVYDAAFPLKSRRKLEQELQSFLPQEPAGVSCHAFAQAISWQGVVQHLDFIRKPQICSLDVPWGFDVHALLLPLMDAGRRSRLAMQIYHDPLDASMLSHLSAGDVLFSSAVYEDSQVFTPELDKAVIRREAPRLAFDRAVYDLTLNQAVEALAEAKTLHDSLERHYIDAMDYGRLGAIRQEFLATLPS